ncbi:hypothetical protein ACH4E8_23275 [Streptomyces sp. NPDC017979]|uniref:hypothetical protein n=1 Tax=Streptomyces sp. NPDC017979 TaxID=3365024 RepID=UPI00379A3982
MGDGSDGPGSARTTPYSSSAPPGTTWPHAASGTSAAASTAEASPTTRTYTDMGHLPIARTARERGDGELRS